MLKTLTLGLIWKDFEMRLTVVILFVCPITIIWKLCTLDMLKSGTEFEFPIFQSWAHYYSKLNWLSVLSNLDDQNKRFSIPMHLLLGFDFEELLTKVSYLFIVVLILKFPFDQQHETC